MPKFVNVAEDGADIPHIVNVDDIIQVKPGLINSNWTGKDKGSTIFLRMNLDDEYQDGTIMREVLTVETLLTVTEVCRRLRSDVFTV